MDKKFIVKLQGKEFVTYEGLLDEAHKRGLSCIETEMVQYDGSECIFKAIVALNGKDGLKTFTGYGDTSASNVNKMIQPHKIRMAETRAKARALRDACNIGMCSVDELGGDSAPKAEVKKGFGYAAIEAHCKKMGVPSKEVYKQMICMFGDVPEDIVEAFNKYGVEFINNLKVAKESK